MHKINLDEFEKVIYLKDTYFPYSYIDHDRYIVRGIIVDKDNKIALHNVVRNDQFGDASYYETPGGGVKNNEDFISALKREIKEEVGVTIKNIFPLAVVDDYYNLIHRHNINLFFIAYVDEIIEKCLQKGGDELIHHTFFIDIDEAIKLYENLIPCPIINIVNNRELPILKLAKSILSKRFL